MDLTPYLPYIYNGGFIVFFLAWLIRDKIHFSERLERVPIKILWIIAVVFFLAMTVANFTFLISDVDDAITGAVDAFLFDGANPYIDKVVPHMPDGENWIFSVYHYFPPDLLIYSAFYLLLLPLNGILDGIGVINSWLFIANIFLVSFSFIMIWNITENEKRNMMVPVYIILISPFLLNNAILMLFLYTVAIAGLNRIGNPNTFRDHGIKVMEFLSAGVKYMTGVFIATEFIHDLIVSLKKKKVSNLLPYFTGGVIFTVLMLPFGIVDVIIATILYQGHPDFREGVAEINGPLLVEVLSFLRLENLFFPLFILSGVFALILTLSLYRRIHDQQIFISFIIMFILPFYGTELFIIPLFAMFYHDILKMDTSLFVKREKIEKINDTG